MKPQLLKVATDFIHSFSARQDTVADINSHWHYHPEVELIYFEKGNGIQFIGDSIQTFGAGDIILVGSNVPHYWRFELSNQENKDVDVKVVHFKEDFWGQQFLHLPENKEILQTLTKAKLGIQVLVDENKQIAYYINQIIISAGSRQIIALMQALLAIHQSNYQKTLVSIGFKYHFQEIERDRIQNIYDYTIANFKEKISLNQIAGIAQVSPNSFCKFFKTKSKKTYSRFLNEIRVSHACQLLIEGSLNVKQICYESGFYNFASFHQYFKNITGKSPLQYQKTYNNLK